LAELMAERSIDDVVVFGGGIIPEDDIPELERLGVARIFTPGATTTEIVDTVVQEDADAVGLSVLSGAHMTLFARLAELMAERSIDDVVVFGGGIIPEEDIPELERLGVARIFTPGATTTEIVDWVRTHVGAPAA
ncbi:MAG: isobutyryl-CoA mutase small subunit, partial [Blastococcus sp.]|nr:isobutyryl-CoA mutase small subunit [Blastococcus sp.]